MNERVRVQGAEAVLYSLKDKIHRSYNGIDIAYLNGETPDEYSDYSAVGFFGPYANSIEQILIRAEVMRAGLEAAGIRNDEGQKIPVVVVAGRSLGSTKYRHLSDGAKKRLKRGDLGPIAAEMIDAIGKFKLGKRAVVEVLEEAVGHSFGASVAIEVASAAKKNMDVKRIAVSDPADVENKRFTQLLGDFMLRSGGTKGLKESIERGGIDLQKAYSGTDTISMLKAGMSGVLWQNYFYTTRALRKNNSFSEKLQRMVSNPQILDIVIGVGEYSSVTPVAEVERAVDNLVVPDDIDPEKQLLFVVFEGEGEEAKHTIGDQFPLMTDLYMRAFR